MYTIMKRESLRKGKLERKMQSGKNQNVNNEETELDINHLMQIRREKLRELQEQGKIHLK